MLTCSYGLLSGMLPLLCPQRAGQSNVCPWPEQENGPMIPHHPRGPRTDIIIVPTCNMYGRLRRRRGHRRGWKTRWWGLGQTVHGPYTRSSATRLSLKVQTSSSLSLCCFFIHNNNAISLATRHLHILCPRHPSSSHRTYIQIPTSTMSVQTTPSKKVRQS